MNNEEKKQLEQLSNESGYTQSAYLISLFYNKRPRPLPPIDYYKMMNQLRLIGNNLNQIAIKANKIGFINSDFYMLQVKQLNEVISDIVSKIQYPEDI